MKLLLSATAVAFALAIGGLATSPAQAEGHGRWCMHSPWLHENDCIYGSITLCEQVRAGSGGFCEPNPHWRRMS